MRTSALIVTTIQSPNDCLNKLAQFVVEKNCKFIIAGDKKTPSSFNIPRTTYLSPEKQLKLFPKFASIIPWNHYSRKNIAYLNAIKKGVNVIRETDDDNYPLPSFMDFPKNILKYDLISSNNKWINIYSYFSDLNIWPRGFSISEVTNIDTQNFQKKSIENGNALIFQGLVNGHPDIDAMYRIVNGNVKIKFNRKKVAKIEPGHWCPFNSQNTVFDYKVFPLLYLPSYCTFRLTDIWRSFVAQRCLWKMGEGVLFHYPTVVQKRNIHNFYKDFLDEVPGYINHNRLTGILEDVNLSNDLLENIQKCYIALIKNKFIQKDELLILDEWISLIQKIWNPY